nr:hypothetical protein [Nostoc sp. DedSLP01]
MSLSLFTNHHSSHHPTPALLTQNLPSPWQGYGLPGCFSTTHNRKVNHTAKYLHQAIRATPGCGTLLVEVKRNPQVAARTAKLIND